MLTFQWPDKFPEIGYVKGVKYVVKIKVDDKFFITHVTSLSFLQKELQTTFGKYQRGGIFEKNLYYPLIKYLQRAESKKIIFDVVYENASGYRVLKTELELFAKEFGKPGCLNEENVPYVPKTTWAKKGSNWLTQTELMNYIKEEKKYIV